MQKQPWFGISSEYIILGPNVLYSYPFQLTKSTSNLNDVVYSGRPKTEEPHVKRTTKKKSEKIEYIVRVDLVSRRILKYY